MSTARRLVSGSAASWARILFTIGSQVAVVPLYLSHWKVETFGVWLAVQSLVYLLSILDLGHQTYLGYEFLKFGRLKLDSLSLYLWSGVACGIVASLLQILLIGVFIFAALVPKLLGVTVSNNSQLLFEASMILVIQGVSWLLCTSVTGLLSRALEAFGYFPRMSWWNLSISIITTIIPVIAVICGAGLLTTGIIGGITSLLCSIPLYVDIFRIIKKEGIPFTPPSIKTGSRNFFYSLLMSGRILLENTRQQGVRLIIAPFGVNILAAFSTMRTMSNFALQGLNTITHPLMPELTRFLHQRDQQRMEAAFGTLWIVLIAVLAPCVVTLQVFIEPLYALWTRGQLPFNASLFAILSLSVLVFAVSQPAIAIVVGNNMLKTQLLFSIITAVIVIGGILLLMPFIGIIGAGIALLCAEVVGVIGFRLAAEKWLKENELQWPRQAFSIGINAVLIAGVAMAGMIAFPVAKWFILAAALACFAWNLYRYLQVLPDIATDKLRRYMVRVPVLRRAIKPGIGPGL